jgi:hypothetical protein
MLLEWEENSEIVGKSKERLIEKLNGSERSTICMRCEISLY